MFCDIKDARLCLDCEALHDQDVCPRCAGRTNNSIACWIQPWLAEGPKVLGLYPGAPRYENNLECAPYWAPIQ